MRGINSFKSWMRSLSSLPPSVKFDIYDTDISSRVNCFRSSSTLIGIYLEYKS